MRSKKQNGQSVVLVTLALVAMMALIGLAVDGGWMFFIKKQAQAAADAAARAAVQEAMHRLGGVTGGFVCPTAPSGTNDVYCAPSIVSCGAISSSSNLYNGCLYAARNGFDAAVNSRQKVTVQANDWSSLPPTAPGVNSLAYWVTVRVVQTVPQVFSAILGNPEGMVAARATAAIVNEVLPGSLYGMNREGDCLYDKNGHSLGECGVDISVSGNNIIDAPNGVLMSSGCNSRNSPSGCDSAAGQTNGGGIVTSPSILVRGTAPSTWGPPPPVDHVPDSSQFLDPTTGLAQPPLAATSPVKTCGLLGGQLAGAVGPYNYYAYSQLDRNNIPIPTGATITITGPTTFSATATCPGRVSLTGGTQASSFPTYFFHGGLNVGSNTVTFGPGQYVMNGSLHDNQGNASDVFEVNTGAHLASSGSGSGYAGNIFIFTAPGYPGLDTQLNAFPELGQISTLVWQGNVDIKGGTGTSMVLNGLLKGASPTEYDRYSGFLFWQDRRNSVVEYNPDGTIANAPATASQMSANRATLDSPRMGLYASTSSLALSGVIYQPRGAWIDLQGGSSGTPVQIITGAVIMGGGGDLLLGAPNNPMLVYINSLIE